jgi:hypothetical protein
MDEVSNNVPGNLQEEQTTDDSFFPQLVTKNFVFGLNVNRMLGCYLRGCYGLPIADRFEEETPVDEILLDRE